MVTTPCPILTTWTIVRVDSRTPIQTATRPRSDPPTHPCIVTTHPPLAGIHTFGGHTDPVYAVAFNPRATDVVATGGGDDRGFVWRVGEDAFMENQGAVFELTGHADTVTSIQFSSTDSGLLATGRQSRSSGSPGTLAEISSSQGPQTSRRGCGTGRLGSSWRPSRATPVPSPAEALRQTGGRSSPVEGKEMPHLKYGTPVMAPVRRAWRARTFTRRGSPAWRFIQTDRRL